MTLELVKNGPIASGVDGEKWRELSRELLRTAARLPEDDELVRPLELFSQALETRARVHDLTDPEPPLRVVG